MRNPGDGWLEEAERQLAGELQSSAEPAVAAAHIYERILSSLSPLVGAAGVNSLFIRSAQLLSADHPYLNGFALRARSHTPGALGELLLSCLQDQEPEKGRQAAQVWFTNFFSLLATFIGAQLTARVLHGVWPVAAEPSLPQRKR